MTIRNFNYEGSYLPGVICNIAVKADFGRSTPQRHHRIYIMECILQPFWILQKVGISFYIWIISLVNSQFALYNHVRGNPLQHPQNTPTWQLEISTMTITNLNYEGSYLPGVICNIVVKTDFGRSTPQMNYGIDIMGWIWHPFWILQEKVGISFYFWIISLVNSQHCPVMSDVTTLDTPETLQNTPTWQLEISTMRAHICQV